MDGSKARGAKIFSLDRRDLWIEALVPGEEGVSAADPILFSADSISFIRGLGAKNSVIRLTSGVDITLRLPQSDLLEKLRNPKGDILDLKRFSYVERQEPLLQRLREEFKAEADDAKYAPLESLTFRAWVRPANKAEFRDFTFRGQDVLMRFASEGDSIMGGRNIRLKMKPGGRVPFEGAEFIIEGTLQEFHAMSREAYFKGLVEIDLRDYSLRKGTVPPPDDAPKPGKAPAP
ncbi:MAG: hypothetical protein EPN97_07045 [Alphaproteobacteria bacterium]|nr:MAG: hypothetical protein EPN97_07045 [Alphaproteobacteria bacterium]